MSEHGEELIAKARKLDRDCTGDGRPWPIMDGLADALETAYAYQEELKGMLFEQQQRFVEDNDILFTARKTAERERNAVLRPRVLTIVEELDALPVSSVIRIAAGIVLEKLTDGYFRPAVNRPYDPFPMWLPATVLYTPEGD